MRVLNHQVQQFQGQVILAHLPLQVQRLAALLDGKEGLGNGAAGPQGQWGFGRVLGMNSNPLDHVSNQLPQELL